MVLKREETITKICRVLRLMYSLSGHLWALSQGVYNFLDLGSQRHDYEHKDRVSSANSTFRFKYFP